eukprot:Hpha_TRINITY_DN11399_c0_g1::TRINITY_DN11399_c0_g1_i1::g.63297::m.63297
MRRYQSDQLYLLSSSGSPCDADTRRRLEDLKLWVESTQIPAAEAKGGGAAASALRTAPRSFAEQIGLAPVETDLKSRLPANGALLRTQPMDKAPQRPTQTSDAGAHAVSPPEDELRHPEWERRKPVEQRTQAAPDVLVVASPPKTLSPSAAAFNPQRSPAAEHPAPIARPSPNHQHQLTAAGSPQQQQPTQPAAQARAAPAQAASPRSGVILAESLEAQLLQQGQKPPQAASPQAVQTHNLSGHFDAAGIEAELFRNARKGAVLAAVPAPAQAAPQPAPAGTSPMQAVDAASLERELIMQATRQAQPQQPQVGGFGQQPSVVPGMQWGADLQQQMLAAQAQGPVQVRLAQPFAQFAAVPRVG